MKKKLTKRLLKWVIINNDYTTGDLLDFAYFKKHKLIAIDLSKQTKLKDPQQINLLENFQEILGQQCSLLLKKS